MDKQTAILPAAKGQLELELMLHINERLFSFGQISQEMRDKAREEILKAA